MAKLNRAAATIALLLLGIALWLWVDHGSFGPSHTWWMVFVMVAITVIMPLIRRAVADVMLKDQNGSSPSFRVSLTVAVAAAGYFAASAQWQGRDIGPHSHDEFMYLTQASQLASGRLWLPLDPTVADFFDSPYLIVRPVYAALCWPGTALAYAPGAMLGLPPWWTAATLAGVTVGLFFHLVRELSASLSTAMMATIFMIVGRPFHTLSVTVDSHVPVLLAGMLATVAAIRWTRKGHVGWAALFGAAGGWAAICRPVDAVCLLLPVLIVAAIDARSRRQAVLFPLAVAALGAFPFVALQLIFDHGVTSRWFDTPFAFYCRRDYPQVAYGFPRYTAAARPLSVIPQKRDLYSQFAIPYILSHQPGNWFHDWVANRVPAAFRGGQPAPLLLITVPLGAAAYLRRRSNWAFAVAASLPLFCLLYAPYTIFLPTYAVLCGPAISLCVTAGVVVIAGMFRSPAMRAAIVAAAIAIAVATLPEINGGSDDPSRPAGVMAVRALEQTIPASQRAVVLVRYHPGNPIHDEPVYNWNVAAPDMARIVLAHDLGLRNGELFRYFAKLQPNRQIYLLDRADYSLHYLGSAADLAHGR